MRQFDTRKFTQEYQALDWKELDDITYGIVSNGVNPFSKGVE